MSPTANRIRTAAAMGCAPAQPADARRRVADVARRDRPPRGEAKAARDRYASLTAVEQEALLTFLRSL